MKIKEITSKRPYVGSNDWTMTVTVEAATPNEIGNLQLVVIAEVERMSE